MFIVYNSEGRKISFSYKVDFKSRGLNGPLLVKASPHSPGMRPVLASYQEYIREIASTSAVQFLVQQINS